MRFVNNPFTDKLDVASLQGSGAGQIETLTGNSGGAVGPDVTFNLNLLGNNTQGINIVGSPGTNTLTVAGLNASTSQIGVQANSSNVQAAAQSSAILSLTPSNITSMFSVSYLPSSQGGTGLSSPAAHSLIVTSGSSPYTPLGVATNGQIPIGSLASDPVLATITPSTGISITNGPGTITIAATGTVPILFTEDSGTAAPSSNNLNLLGSGSITTTGSGSTVTTALTGLTNHAVLVGAGTSTITKVGPTATSGQVLQSAGSSADPAFSTATYPSSTTISQILYSSANNVVSGLATANRAVLTTNATGVPVATALATDGQLIIGSTSGAPAAAVLTQGAGISITNGSNSITIAATGAGFAWTDVTGATQTIVAENGYLSDRGGAVAFTLPASATIGDIFRIVGVQGSWNIVQNANQQIKFGSTATTVGAGGSLASTDAGDCIECVATNTSASTVWRVMSSIGNITVV